MSGDELGEQQPVTMPSLYTRWTRTSDRRVTADMLGGVAAVVYDVDAGIVLARVGTGDAPTAMDPDTARMIGVRLIEAATRAESGRRVRDGRDR